MQTTAHVPVRAVRRSGSGCVHCEPPDCESEALWRQLNQYEVDDFQKIIPPSSPDFLHKFLRPSQRDTETQRESFSCCYM